MARLWSRLRGRLRASVYPAWLFGTLLATAVAAAYVAGFPFLVELEGRATDLLFRYGRADPPEPNRDIVHVDIDDTSLETVGRWPWNRDLLAQSVRALDRMGASVIALDLLLIDPQDPDYQADGSVVDHDQLLAAAFREVKAKTILAVKVDVAGDRMSRMWRSAEGRRKWRRILEILERDISLDSADVIAKAELSGGHAARVRGRIGAIKQIVIRRVAHKLARAGQPVDLGSLRRALLPAEKNESLGWFPAQRLIDQIVDLELAIGSIEKRLPRARDDVGYPRAETVLPPQPAFAEVITGVGVVNSDQDQDGTLRRTHLRWRRGDRVYPQFGVAAAAAFLGKPLDFLVDPGIDMPETSFRVSGTETVLLAWPRIDPERPILGLASHFSLGRVISLLRAEEKARALHQRYLAHSRVLVAELLADPALLAEFDDPAKRGGVMDELRGEIEFMDLDHVDESKEDEEGRKKIRAARLWATLDREHHIAQRTVKEVAAEVRGAVANKLVFVGWYATGNFGDFYPTAAHERTPGVVAHAILANAVLSGYVVTETPAWAGALVTILLGLLAALVTHRAEPRLSFFVTLLILVAFVAVNTLIVFGTLETLVAMATPITGVAAAWAGTVTMNAVRALREKAQLRRQFGARISKKLFDYLSENPDRVHLEGEEREVTCLFSDLAGFTSISEQLDSKTTVSLLNKYMWAMNDEMSQLSAYVNKFLGDGIMAIWGAFAVDTPHADLACRAAIKCMDRLDALNETPDFKALPRLSMRIGIATGVVTVGDCGAPPDLRDYTVIGDSANLAARLESANKQFGTRILINGRTKELIGDDILTRPLGRITVVGQKVPTEIHEVLALRESATAEQHELVAMTANAVRLFQERKLDESKAVWVGLMDRFGPSKIGRLYVQEAEAALQASDEPFAGVLQLTSK